MKTLPLLTLGTIVLSLTFSVEAQYLGVTCGYNYDNELSGPYQAATNTPLYNPQSSNPNATWTDWAAELKQAGVDFVCPNLRGSQPNTSVSPTNIAPFIPALNNAGNVTKVALFDDNASSWTAQYNQALGYGYDYTVPFDLANTNNWKYIYDWNYKLFYQTVPYTNLFLVNGRPLIMIWSTSVSFLTNEQGNLSRALLYVRTNCMRDFGFNPFIVPATGAIVHDSTCTNPGVLDGMQGWFTAGPSGPAYTLSTWNGVSIGMAVPQFHAAGDSGFLDPNHGQLFETNLSNTVGAGALVTLCEGFTDFLEDATMFRVRNLSTSGAALPYADTDYDYPNQRLDLLRKHSRNPFPATLLFEAEGCDNYGGANGGNGKVNFYRNGNIAIENTSDTGGGWDVGWIQSGEWFEWESVPLNGTPHFQVRIASTTSTCTGHFVIDGVTEPSQTLPNTGGSQTWTTYDFGAYGSYTNSYHTVRFVSDNGGISFNWWQIQASSSAVANGIYKLVNLNSGLALDAKGQNTTNGTPLQQYSYSGGNNQRWAVTNMGTSYKILGVQSGRSLDVKGQSTANGATVQLYDYSGGANQQWVITPTSGGYNTIQGVQSSKLMEVSGSATTNGASVDIWSSTGGNNQQWSFQAP